MADSSADSTAVVIPKVITFLSSLLQRVTESNDLIHPQEISIFHGLARPTISIQNYLERIFKYANCSPSCFVVAYVYLDRFSQKNSSFPISSFNVHRLLITSVLVSAKFMDDIYYNNAFYAKVGGISTGEMNSLEVDFLFGLGFQLNVTPASFHTYCSHLQREMLMEESCLNVARPLKLQGHSSGTTSTSTSSSCFQGDESTHQKQLAAV